VYIEDHLHSRALEAESLGGTEPYAGAAMDAELVLAPHLVFQGLHHDLVFLEELNSSLDLVVFPSQFEQDTTFTPGEDFRLKNIEDQIKIPRQTVNHGLVHNVRFEYEKHIS
jgi:hypothetical protein